MEASRAATVKLKAAPAVAEEGALTEKCVAPPAFTPIVALPVIDAVTVSVAVRVWLPAVFSVAENAPVPLLSVESAGNVAAPSELLKCTVPL